MQKILPMTALLSISSAQTWGVTPEGIFADGLQESPGNKTGIVVRKGTIKALIDNVILLNKEIGKGSNKLDPRNDLKQTVRDIKEAIPLLEDVFVFDVFPIEDWFDSADRAGNVMVGVFYLKEYPEKLTQSLRDKMEKMLKQDLHPVLRMELETFI